MSAAHYTTLAALDFETTGTDPLTCRPVSVALVVDGDDLLYGSAEVCELIDAGVEIPEGASNVHGITRDRLAAEQARPAHDVIADVLASLHRLAAAGVPLVIFNAPFDWPLLTVEEERHGLVFPPKMAIVDPTILDRRYDKWRRGSRTLSDVALHYGVDLTDAHDAGADCRAAIGVARKLLTRYHLDRLTPARLHDHQAEEYLVWRDDINAYWRKKGIEKAIVGAWPHGELGARREVEASA